MDKFNLRYPGFLAIGVLAFLWLPTHISSQQSTASLIVIEAVDHEPDGDYDGDDLDAAFRRCTRSRRNIGCIIELLPAVYHDVQAKIPPSVYEIRGQHERSVLRGPVRPRNAPILLREPRDGGYGTRFRNFVIDGNKQNLISSPGSQHNCIRISDKTEKTLSGGLIQGIRCESVAHEGFYLEDAPDWVIRDNTIRYVGCWDAIGTNEAQWSPNGIDPRLMSCGRWGQLQADEFNQPGRKTNGIGIEISRNSHNVEISRNHIQYFTKIGIQGIAGAANTPDQYPKNGRVFSNTVEWGLTGIAMVRTIGWSVENNLVRDMAPAWMFGNVGKGYGCAHGGNGNKFIGNIAVRTGGVGFDFGCGCEVPSETAGQHRCGIIAEENVTLSSCLRRGKGLGALDLRAHNWKPGAPYREDVTLRGNVVLDTACDASVLIEGYRHVTIAGSPSSLESGRRFGLQILNTADLSIDSTILRGKGSGFGVMIDMHSTRISISGRPSGSWTKSIVDQSIYAPRPTGVSSSSNQ